MAILKIRDADGNIKPIAIMKGDKGDGIPDGGSAGQVVKKTADGTEWADFASTPSVVMSNTDTTVTTVAITQKGLYEVEVAYSRVGTYDGRHRQLVSIDDLSKTQKWESSLFSFLRSYLNSDDRVDHRMLTLTYDNGVLSSQMSSNEVHIYSSRFAESVSVINNSHFIAEVKLLIPYAQSTCVACINHNQVDAFADNQPVLNADQTAFDWSGNWTLGDIDASGNYREFNTVHTDVNSSTQKWLIYTENGVDPCVGFWHYCAGYRVTGTVPKIGTSPRGYDMVLVWTAPEDGAVKIGSSDFTFTDANSNFNFAVYVNGVQVYPATGNLHFGYKSDQIKDKDTFIAAFADFTLNVKMGDKVQFVCSRVDNSSNDAFMPTVEYVHDCVLADTSL